MKDPLIHILHTTLQCAEQFYIAGISQSQQSFEEVSMNYTGTNTTLEIRLGSNIYCDILS